MLSVHRQSTQTFLIKLHLRTLQEDTFPSSSFELTGGDILTENSTIVVVQLNENDFNSIMCLPNLAIGHYF